MEMEMAVLVVDDNGERIVGGCDWLGDKRLDRKFVGRKACMGRAGHAMHMRICEAHELVRHFCAMDRRKAQKRWVKVRVGF